VIDWLAYGHALKTEKGASQTFGKGDVRGVIASESSNNAKEGGALVPTVAFGVPGSASMAVLLGAFLIHGLVPGPDMLTKHLDITYTMVWSIALANILGAGLCYAFSPQFAKLATLRYTLILPAVLGVIYIGAFEASRNWGDLIALLMFGVLGWVMKQNKWPRPPLVLGLVLGDTIERYMFISIERYGFSWLWRPVVAILLGLAIIGVIRPLIHDMRRQGGIAGLAASFGAPRFQPGQLFGLFYFLVIGGLLTVALSWHFSAKLVPMVVGILGLTVIALSLFNDLCRKPVPATAGTEAGEAKTDSAIHMDITSDIGDLPLRTVMASRDFLRLSARVHGRDGGDRPDSHRGHFRGRLHETGGPGALATDSHLFGGPDGFDLHRVRPLHVDPLAAHADRHASAHAEDPAVNVGSCARPSSGLWCQSATLVNFV
jgi:hypothetical protein